MAEDLGRIASNLLRGNVGRRVQRTFYVPFDNDGLPDTLKVKIVVSPSTYQQNFAGWNVVINGYKQFVRLLDRQEAQDKAYVNWVKKFIDSSGNPKKGAVQWS